MGWFYDSEAHRRIDSLSKVFMIERGSQVKDNLDQYRLKEKVALMEMRIELLERLGKETDHTPRKTKN